MPLKNRHFVALLIALLTLSLLTACSARAAEAKLDRAEDAIERKLDKAEDAVENAIRDAVSPETAPADPKPAQTVPAVTKSPGTLSPEEAQAIALAHAGFTADQVRFLRTEYESDDRVPRYDVSFREGPWEYEYEIHAETGAILSFEKDD